MKKDQAYSIFEQVRKASTGGDVEVIIHGGKSTLTRFANNTILQNVADENTDVSVRVQFGGRTARASTNKLDADSLKAVVKAAEQLAKVQEDDPDLPPMFAGAGPVANSPSRRFEATAAIDAIERGDRVAKMVAVAKRERLNSAGVYAVNDHFEALFNSHGVERWYEQTLAEASITMTAPDSTGWQKANSSDGTQFDPVRMAEIAAEKAKASAKPRELSPGKYTVILEPSAVLDIVGFMFWDFSGAAFLEERSFLNNRMGTQLFGGNISIADDWSHPQQTGANWDGEGVPREKVDLVVNGVPKNVVYSRASSERIKRSDFASKLDNVRATGHGFPLPNEIGEVPTNIVFRNAGETQTVDKMIASAERAILVTRLWYIREVDPYEKIVTGMTRDGTFLVENGKLQCGVRNFRFNESLIHMLNHVEAMSAPARASGEESFDMVVPAMQVSEFNFTEVTKF